MILLFDVGGTKTRIASSYDGVKTDEIKIYDTPRNFDEFLYFFSDLKSNGIDTVAGGLAGVLSKDKEMLVRAPNLREWVGVPIKRRLAEYSNSQVILENDAALAGLGEACFGAGKDKEIVGYLTISTGIGGTRIIERKIDRNVWGFEPGQQIIDADLSIWPESPGFNPDNISAGSVESLISGSAIKARYGESADKIKDKSVWNHVEKLLAVCINNTVSFWSPEVIVLGGGIILENAVSVENIKKHLEKIYRVFPEIPEIRKAELGDSSVILGALSLTKRFKNSLDTD